MCEYEWADDIEDVEFPKWVPDDVIEEWRFYEIMYEEEKAYENNIRKLIKKSGRYQDYEKIDYLGEQPKEKKLKKILTIYCIS